jgi:hypothetical protein
VEEVIQPSISGQSCLVRLACADDDAQGQSIDVYWDYEIDRRILAAHYKSESDSSGPSWLAFIGHMKDSL